MAKKPGPGRCVHCLNHFEKRNWDHVLPRAWYPNTTPSNLYKWQVPSCKPCNEEYGALETDLLIRLSLCLDPSDPDTAGIVARGLRAIDPSAAHGQADRRSREAKRNQLRREMLEGNQIPTFATYPNFGLREGETTADRGAILVPAESIRKLAEKIVRGITYLQDGKFIEPEVSIDFFALTDAGARPIIEVLDAHGEVFSRGPGIVVQRARAEDHSDAAMYCITLLGRFKMYAAVGVDG